MDKNQLLISRYINELNKRNFAILDEVLAQEITLDNQKITPGQYKQQIKDRIAEFPDYHVSIVKMETVGDEVVLNWNRTYTDKTNEKISEELTSEYRIKDGKIYEVR